MSIARTGFRHPDGPRGVRAPLHEDGRLDSLRSSIGAIGSARTSSPASAKLLAVVSDKLQAQTRFLYLAWAAVIGAVFLTR